jgi:hypothetical protein
MDARGEPADHRQCAACGGTLHVLAEIPPRNDAHSSIAPRTAYLRCERCAQIKIVEQ